MTLHDIKADGINYILEWDKDNGTVSITETCEKSDNDDDCDYHETYDYKDVL